MQRMFKSFFTSSRTQNPPGHSHEHTVKYISFCIWVKSKAFKQCLFCYCRFQAFPLIRRKQTYEDKMGPNIAITACHTKMKKGRLKNIHPLGLGQSVSLALCLQLENNSLLLLMVASSCWNMMNHFSRRQGCILGDPWQGWTSWARLWRQRPWAPTHSTLS